jgi:small-conductance mechanosensitive channel
MTEQVAGLQISTLVLIALVVVLAGVTHILFRWWVRRRVSQRDVTAASSETASRWFPIVLWEVSPPILAIVWLHCLYLVLTILLDQPPARAFADRASLALHWFYGLCLPALVFWLLSRIGSLVERILASISHRWDTPRDDAILPLVGRTVRQALPFAALLIAAPALPMSPDLEGMLNKATSLLFIGVMAFLLYQVVEAGAELIIRRHRTDTTDNIRARAIHTQVMVLKKVVVAVIGVFALASMLMVFESARQFGANILASAGIAGIVVGLAAQRSIATLLAGFQIALTQPIRVDDVVIVENEWGRIEEITLTYVVVRIWDLRRLIIPITYFIEKPFQNWTRSSADLLATVFLHVDYTVPLNEMRGELTRILESSSLWDKKVNVLQVTDAKERTLEIRALASAKDSSSAWNLRCEIREKLVTFLQRNYPQSLPRLRASVEETSPELREADAREAYNLAGQGNGPA